MENSNITTQETQKPVEYAGFWWRFLAYIIDEIILSFIEFIIILPVLGIFGLSIFGLVESGYNKEEMLMFLGPMFGILFLIIIISIAINWLYFAIMESSKTQGTLGKMLLKIKVTDYNGERISFAKATCRYFGKIISGMILMIGYIMAGFTDRKQALHDMMASCYVIKE